MDGDQSQSGSRKVLGNLRKNVSPLLDQLIFLHPLSNILSQLTGQPVLSPFDRHVYRSPTLLHRFIFEKTRARRSSSGAGEWRIVDRAGRGI